jgi:hypothetical protein
VFFGGILPENNLHCNLNRVPFHGGRIDRLAEMKRPHICNDPKSTFSQPRSFYTQKYEQQQVEKKWLVPQGQMPTHDSRRSPSIDSSCDNAKSSMHEYARRANAKSSVREYAHRLHMTAKVIKSANSPFALQYKFAKLLQRKAELVQLLCEPLLSLLSLSLFYYSSVLWHLRQYMGILCPLHICDSLRTRRTVIAFRRRRRCKCFSKRKKASLKKFLYYNFMTKNGIITKRYPP